MGHYIGMKAHIGVDEFSGLVHHAACTTANVSDVSMTHALLHGKEERAFGEAGYTGADNRVGLERCKATFFIAEKRGNVKAIKNKRVGKQLEPWEHFKASTRTKVEQPFRVLKQQCGYTKMRYRGLLKNAAQVATLFALSNLWMVRRPSLSAQR